MHSIKPQYLLSQTQFHFHHETPNRHQKPTFLIISTTHIPKQRSVPFRHRNLDAFPLKSNNCAAPISKAPHVSPPSSFKRSFVRGLAEKAVVLLLGSFAFVGFLSSKPALALPAKVESRCTELEFENEEKMFEKLLEKEPGNMEALKAILYRKMRRGKMEEAVKYVEKLIGLEPKEVEWKLLQALCYEMMGQLSKAKRLFKEILKERPLLVRALHGLAMVMHKNNEGPAVFEMLNKALEVARREKRVTEERNIQVLIGQMHIVKGELEEGLKKFQEMIDENPRDFRPYLCQGIIYSLMEKNEEAAKQFEIYWSLAPEEFPQRGFLDDVVLAAQTKSRERLQKQFEAKSPYRS